MLRRNECHLNFKNRPVRTGDIKGGPKPLPLIGVARSLPLIGLSCLSMPLILIPYLNHAFDNIVSEFEPSGSIILVPRAQNVKTLNFDL